MRDSDKGAGLVRKDPLDPVTSPYAPERMPPPTLEELAQLGLRPKSDEKSVPVSTKVRPDMVYAMDRILERRLYNMKSRHDFYRLAMMNLIVAMEDEIQQDHVKTLVRRMEDQRRLVGELQQMRHVTEMVYATRKAVALFIQYDNVAEAIQALRNAKRFSEEIPYDGLRARFILSLYGGEDGQEKPAAWESDRAAVLWDRVMSGELDIDDADELHERMKVY